METGPRASSTQGVARIDGRRERTSAGKASSATTPQGTQAGATEERGVREDWLYVATADPALGSKRSIRQVSGFCSESRRLVGRGELV